MRTNTYPGRCVECGVAVSKVGAYLYGAANAVVCKQCAYDFYGEKHGYFAPAPIRTDLGTRLVRARGIVPAPSGYCSPAPPPP